MFYPHTLYLKVIVLKKTSRDNSSKQTSSRFVCSFKSREEIAVELYPLILSSKSYASCKKEGSQEGSEEDRKEGCQESR